MSSSQSLGGQTPVGRVLGPSLDQIIKNASWRKHSNIVSAAKSALDLLHSLAPSSSSTAAAPLIGISFTDSVVVLSPILLSLVSSQPKLIHPALLGISHLFSLNLVRTSLSLPDPPDPTTAAGSPPSSPSQLISRLIQAVCDSCSVADDAAELAVLRVLLSAVRSPCLVIRGEFLVHMIRTCYNVYLGGQNGTNQICAKAVLAQIMVIIFARVEDDRMGVSVRVVNVGELLEFADKNLNEGSSIQFCQGFLSEVVDGNDGNVEEKDCLVDAEEVRNGELTEEEENVSKGEETSVENDEARATGLESKIREDGFLVFKNLCKLSMKFSSQEQADDQILLRGKVLSLELLKVIMDKGGPIWRTNERFLNAIKQFLCLSLLKNSAMSVMTIFQLQCSIFTTLLTKYRLGLKAEIGIFFPMLILRVLENVLQPSFLQKMTVLNLLEKICQDPSVIIDIFVNYDCDVDAPNIFERTVNGLLKTALGPPAGSATTLSPVQDISFRHESVKCLVSITKSMAAWMDQQLRLGESYPQNNSDNSSNDGHSTLSADDGHTGDYDLQSDGNSESGAISLEQRRAYKIELQKGVAIFNRKPSKGIEFLINTKKIGGSPEEVAAFLKNTAGLNETVIGDYLGERDEFPLKVMHAYVDSFDFKGKDFGESIRFFLRGFRLPGEAQKIDRIMEKFAERFCKCNPESFSSADTAYVLAYSVIMLNTDAHNNMVKDKMSKADFIRNNRGIDDGKDLPEEYLGALYNQIVKDEIKMSSDSSVQPNKQVNSLNKLLGLDGILNLVAWKQTEEKPLGANGLLVKHIQEQFKAKAGKSESVYHSVNDVAILRFMVEVCWGPMLAAFSMTLDQSDDKLATAQCLLGFRFSVHITAVIGMQTQRDAFMTSLAKFTNLHCAADMKQKNVDAVKAIISIAIEDGNYLQEAWEHILTCLSRIENLLLLGEGATVEGSFLGSSTVEPEENNPKAGMSSFMKKGTIQNPAVIAVVRGGSYDSTSVAFTPSGPVTREQISNFISNLNLLDQIGNFELNHVFVNSQRLSSEAIVAFVRALCKVSMVELQSPTDPRVFSLTKIVEIAHYNMNRIRLVWSRIWSVLSEFFVSVGLSENLSVAIFVMDSLRQLAMKFLEREELANYNFQNEFLRPFVIVMQQSNSAEIRELIVRCISQMVLSRVSNVKSGWKSVFTIFTTAAADEQKSIVLLAFETMEKIVREYFPYITETEAMTFTDCVRCLLAFTTSRFNSDVTLNAIAFLRFCAVKLAEGGLSSNNAEVSLQGNDSTLDTVTFDAKDESASFWVPLLTGLSKLTSDSRLAIRKTAMEVLFNILKDHGRLFSDQFWVGVYNHVICPTFTSDTSNKRDVNAEDNPSSTSGRISLSDRSMWDSETSSVATHCLVDVFVDFFSIARSQLPIVLSILTAFVKSPVQGTAGTGVTALVRLADDLGSQLSGSEWGQIYTALNEAAESTIPGFLKVFGIMDGIDLANNSQSLADMEIYSDHGLPSDDLDHDCLQTAAYVISRMKSHISVHLLILQVVTNLYSSHPKSLCNGNVSTIIKIFSLVTSHARKLGSESVLLKKIQKASSVLDISEPPVVHFENESYQSLLSFLHYLLNNQPDSCGEFAVESHLVSVCVEVLQTYLDCARDPPAALSKSGSRPVAARWVLPISSAKKEELSARTSLVVSSLRTLTGLERESFRRYVTRFFPLLVELVRREHSSREVQLVLTQMFQSYLGPIVLES
ncbi:hypothetical protein MLD38_013580 [Melastoma candidum]|uniref:Uncharacterized protein n=1 Tax=Melastoma candidum TaxID=119954 RepID=A0ACB9RE88_9MYRT|nr:hypothetical protein MLD38_013580 [Melastoma candidum]